MLSLEPVTNDSEGTDESSKEASDFGIEPLTRDSDGAEESNKESINDFSKDNTRSTYLYDRVI